MISLFLSMSAVVGAFIQWPAVVRGLEGAVDWLLADEFANDEDFW